MFHNNIPKINRNPTIHNKSGRSKEFIDKRPSYNNKPTNIKTEKDAIELTINVLYGLLIMSDY